MKKRFLILCTAIACMAAISAQTVTETAIDVNGLKPVAYTATFTQSESLVNDAFKKYIKDAGYKTTKESGYQAVMNTVISEIYSAPINLYTKIEEKGKRNTKTVDVVFAAISSDLKGDGRLIAEGVRRYMENFIVYLNRYQANENLKEVEKRLDKATKESNRAAGEVASCAKKITNLEGKITNREKDIQDAQKSIEGYQKDIKEYQEDIKKMTSKKAELEKKAKAAEEAVKAIETEANEYRMKLN